MRFKQAGVRKPDVRDFSSQFTPATSSQVWRGPWARRSAYLSLGWAPPHLALNCELHMAGTSVIIPGILQPTAPHSTGTWQALGVGIY